MQKGATIDPIHGGGRNDGCCCLQPMHSSLRISSSSKPLSPPPLLILPRFCIINPLPPPSVPPALNSSEQATGTGGSGIMQQQPPSPVCRPRFRRPKVRTPFDRSRRRRRMGMRKMRGGSWGLLLQLRNMRLLVRNRWIMEENERLRQKALLLNQQNQALLSLLTNIRSTSPSKQPLS